MPVGDPESKPRLAVLTAHGRGAIAVVRVWGRGAVEITDAVFRPARGRTLASTRPGRLRLGRIGGGVGDEVVAVVLDERPPAVEIQCHGGVAAMNLVVDALVEAGAVAAVATHGGGHSGTSALKTAAFSDLARAPTLRTAEILLEQASGALDGELLRLTEELRDRRACSLQHLDRLIARGRVGLRLITGWRVVIAGRPNVGKSRLLNALAGYQRVIVDPTPGTTRDAVTALLAFDGWPVELVDTAGLRKTSDVIERLGIEQSRRQADAADLLLLCLDLSRALTPEDNLVPGHERPCLLVATKADLPAAWDVTRLSPSGKAACVVSAESGAGLEALIAAIVSVLVPDLPEPGAGVPFRPEHLGALERARLALSAGDHELAIQGLLTLVGARNRSAAARQSE